MVQLGTHFGRLDSLSRAWDAACRRQPPPSSSSWSARDRPWPRRGRPTRPWPDPRQVMRRPARATHAARRRAFRQQLVHSEKMRHCDGCPALSLVPPAIERRGQRALCVGASARGEPWAMGGEEKEDRSKRVGETSRACIPLGECRCAGAPVVCLFLCCSQASVCVCLCASAGCLGLLPWPPLAVWDGLQEYTTTYHGGGDLGWAYTWVAKGGVENE
eukprot:scaffold6677_cov86-Isochrysis_galbana.AAC.3